MPKLCERNLCSGCHACYSACPTNSIKMQADMEGFLYPVIDYNSCVDCKLCEKSCPILKASTKSDKLPIAFAAYSKEDSIREKSSSGGIFFHIAKHIIEGGGVVFGASFDDNFNVAHKGIENIEEIVELQGSKYVQSEIGQAFEKAKYFLENGRTVLFTGTPCQIEGLYAYLGKDYENLYTQDFICHGVPSPKVWQLYLEHRENKAASKTRRTFFRHKKYGWEKFSVLLEYSNNTEYLRPLFEDAFMRGFLADLYLRPSCHQCSFKGINRKSDITLADFWGVEKVNPEMYDEFGVSLILINSRKGKDLFSNISSCVKTAKCDINKAIEYNRAAVVSAIAHKKRKEFLDSVSPDNFEEKIDSALKQSFINKLKTKIKNALIKIKRLAK